MNLLTRDCETDNVPKSRVSKSRNQKKTYHVDIF